MQVSGAQVELLKTKSQLQRSGMKQSLSVISAGIKKSAPTAVTQNITARHHFDISG